MSDEPIIESNDRSAPVAAGQPVLGLSGSAWLHIGVTTVLFCFLFRYNLQRLWAKTNPFYGEANWGHAICIPLIGLYYLYVNRQRLLHPAPAGTARRRAGLELWCMVALALGWPLLFIHELARSWFWPASEAVAAALMLALALCVWRSDLALIRRALQHSAGWFGGCVMFLGITLFAYAIYPGQNDFLKDLGMVVTLFGVVLALAGWGVMRVAWFPIAFLVCGIPWPGLVYSRVAGPLQQLAATVAVWTLQMTGVNADVFGTKIIINGYGGVERTLNVAEACAGLRSLMTFISVGAAVAFLSSRPLWQKIIVVLSAIPIAIFCNVMRVSGQGLLDHYVSQQLSEDFAHQFVGLIMLVPAFLLILLVGWILDQIFLEQIDRHIEAAAPKVISRSMPVVRPAALPAGHRPRTLAAVRADEARAAAEKQAAAKMPITAPVGLKPGGGALPKREAI